MRSKGPDGSGGVAARCARDKRCLQAGEQVFADRLRPANGRLQTRHRSRIDGAVTLLVIVTAPRSELDRSSAAWVSNNPCRVGEPGQ
jgi:hypothetical protein